MSISTLSFSTNERFGFPRLYLSRIEYCTLGRLKILSKETTDFTSCSEILSISSTEACVAEKEIINLFLYVEESYHFDGHLTPNLNSLNSLLFFLNFLVLFLKKVPPFIPNQPPFPPKWSQPCISIICSQKKPIF